MKPKSTIDEILLKFQLMKDEIQLMKGDVNQLQQNVIQLQENLVKLNEKVSKFYDLIDSVMGDFKKFDEEQTLLSGRVSDHSDRLEKLEEYVQRVS